jgi:PKD repeat protein
MDGASARAATSPDSPLKESHMYRPLALLLTLLAFLLHPIPTLAQYMYLDSDGDGIHTAADKLADNGLPTTVRAYLITNRDRIGTTRTCADGTGNTITVYSYAVNLQALGGTVTFGAATSASPFTTDIGSNDPGDGLRNYVSFADATGTGLPEGGPHLLFTVPATGATGNPRLDIVIAASPSITATDPTYFASACLGGSSASNIWFLGTSPGAADGEWYDVDGLAPSQEVVNAPPVLSAIGNMTVDEGQATEQPVAATDPDGNALAFSKASGPAYMTVTTVDPGAGSASGTVRLAPGFADAGGAAGTVRVSDGLANDEESFTITVNNVLRPLDLFDIPDYVLREGFTEEGSLSASNPDGGYVHFEKTEGPAFMEVHDYAPLTGKISIVVPYDQSQVGVHPATVTATDGIQSDSESFTITVTDYQFPFEGYWYVGAAPRLGATAHLYAFFYDGDGDQPTSITFDPGTIPPGDARTFTQHLFEFSAYGQLDWTPTTLGTFHFSATATKADGASLTLPFEVEITQTEHPPTSNPGGPYSGLVGIPVEFDGRASSDPDGDELYFNWQFGDGHYSFDSVAQHTYLSQGTFTVTLTVFDRYTSATGSTTARILEAFEARAFTVPGQDPIRLASQKPTHCFGLEPVQSSYRNEDVDVSTLRLSWAGNTGGVAPIAGKSVTIEDFDHNGVSEISVCFSKESLRTLFATLPPGQRDVPVRLEGLLASGGRIRATFTVAVVGGSALAASVSPNPLNPDAVLSFRTSAAGRVSVALYDARGRRVRTLHDGVLPAGFHDIRIDGRTDQGTRLSSGVYFYAIESSEGSRRGRLTVVR